MKYRVLQDCFFAFRYWNKDEIAEFEVDPKNEHFALVKGEIRQEVPVVPVPTTMYKIGNEKNEMPKAGMSYVPETEEEYEKKTGRKKPGRKPKTT